MRTLTVMAGGGGVRFWPTSRRQRPKQFLSLDGQRSLLQLAIDRAIPMFGWNQVSIVTGSEHQTTTLAQLPDLLPENLIVEPAAKNTAACLALAAAFWVARDPQTVMLVTPADHLISPEGAFQRTVLTALEFVEEHPEAVCLLGISPTRPATGYGYIEAVLSPDSPSDQAPGSVIRFREKPDAATAEQFVASGRYLWNSGMFVWRAARFLQLLDRYHPEIAAVAKEWSAAQQSGDTLRIAEATSRFHELPSIAVDYAVLEPLSREAKSDLFVLPAQFSWSDVGSWQTWPELHGRDEHGNTIRGSHAGINTHDCIIETNSDHLVATCGVDGLLIVHTATATLVARRDDEKSLRMLVAELERLGHTEWL